MPHVNRQNFIRTLKNPLTWVFFVLLITILLVFNLNSRMAVLEQYFNYVVNNSTLSTGLSGGSATTSAIVSSQTSSTATTSSQSEFIAEADDKIKSLIKQFKLPEDKKELYLPEGAGGMLLRLKLDQGINIDLGLAQGGDHFECPNSEVDFVKQENLEFISDLHDFGFFRCPGVTDKYVLIVASAANPNWVYASSFDIHVTGVTTANEEYFKQAIANLELDRFPQFTNR